MSIYVARDKRTGYPVVRLQPEGPWAGLLPVTKFQVENWLENGGLRSAGPLQVTDLTRRLEMHEPDPAYPPSVRRLSRVPIPDCTRENAVSVLASQLTAWTPEDDTRTEDVRFPTPASEWGRIATWLRGRAPSTEEWGRTRLVFSRFKTADLLDGVLAQRIAWDPVVKALLLRLRAVLDANQTGLPFMNLGLYELTGNKRRMDKMAAGPSETIYRPMVAGDSDVWPTLDATAGLWRPLLDPAMPAVGLRLWFSDAGCAFDADRGDRLCSFEAAYAGPGDAAPHRSPAGTLRGGRAPTKYCRERITMNNRCSVCYGDIDDQDFRNWPVIWHYTEQEAGREKPVAKHARYRPTEGAVADWQALHHDYLAAARNHVNEIRSVTLSGATKSGKGMFLLGLAGLMAFPLSRAPFLNTFPQRMDARHVNAWMIDPARAANHVNLPQQMEELWIDGMVPIRTVAIREALRYPLLFSVLRDGMLGFGQQRKRLTLILNDIAGEVVSDPQSLPSNEWYKHLGATTDVLFLVPADLLAQGANHLMLFANGLGAVESRGEALNLEKINLILAVSQIDKLKHSDPHGLLEIFRAPEIMPFDPQATDEDRARYFATLPDIHCDLESWLGHHYRGLVQEAERFATVRYCGFSSVGCEVINRQIRPGSESCLPFEPRPFRVIDPLLWLFRDNGLLDF